MMKMYQQPGSSNPSFAWVSFVFFLAGLSSLVIFPQVSHQVTSSNGKRRNDGFLSAASSWFQSSKNLWPDQSTSIDSIDSPDDEFYYSNEQQADEEARLKSINRLDRFDHDPYEYHSSKHHHHQQAVHHEAASGKEISLVYPVLLALLILGALFVPFISLFFYLAVSAFNCHGIGGGFAQVTPVFGRRRRRKRELHETGARHPQAAARQGNSSFLATTTTTAATINDPMSIQVENPITGATLNSSSYSQASAKSEEEEEQTSSAADTFIHRLPRLLLSDSIELARELAAAAAASSKGSPLDNSSFARRMEDFLLQDLSGDSSVQLYDEYMFWRRQLARNTIKLREALGAWIED